MVSRARAGRRRIRTSAVGIRNSQNPVTGPSSSPDSDRAIRASPKPVGLYDDEQDAKFWQGVRANPKRSTAEVRSKFRDIDRRLADIETYYVSRDSRLSDEIEQLR